MTDAVDEALQAQIRGCRNMGAPLSAAVLDAVRRDVLAGGASAVLFASWRDESAETLVREAVALRVLGGLNVLALTGEAPALAAAYPRDGFPGDAETAAHAVPALVAAHGKALTAAMKLPPQTNEPQRSAALLGGFLTVAGETGLPLRCLEVGTSAGLNQLWDAYVYDLGAAGRRGPAHSPVTLAPDWRGSPPPDPPWPAVVERRACDQAPVDLTDPVQALRLQAFVWPEQTERVVRLKAAMALAVERGVRVERADAAAWAETWAMPKPGVATVLYHSIVYQYLSGATRDRFDAAVARAAQAATTAAPFAWLRMEGLTANGYRVALSLWPGGAERELARTHPHGQWVAWTNGAQGRGADAE